MDLIQEKPVWPFFSHSWGLLQEMRSVRLPYSILRLISLLSLPGPTKGLEWSYFSSQPFLLWEVFNGFEKISILTLPIYIIFCGLAAIVPLVVATPDFKPDFVSFPGWPKQFEDRPLMELPLSKRERRFNNDFPGRIARFTDGTREFVIRWVIQETRKLHPGADCFKGIGYFI